MTRVKIFMGWGGSGAADIERQFDAWSLHGRPEVISVSTAMCSVGDRVDRYQCLMLTVHYREATA